MRFQLAKKQVLNNKKNIAEENKRFKKMSRMRILDLAKAFVDQHVDKL